MERSAGSNRNASVVGVVESRGVVVGVGEQTVDAVEAAAGLGQTFNDPFDDGDRVSAVVVAEVV